MNCDTCKHCSLVYSGCGKMQYCDKKGIFVYLVKHVEWLISHCYERDLARELLLNESKKLIENECGNCFPDTGDCNLCIRKLPQDGDPNYLTDNWKPQKEQYHKNCMDCGKFVEKEHWLKKVPYTNDRPLCSDCYSCYEDPYSD